jgi:hypothetical protein
MAFALAATAAVAVAFALERGPKPGARQIAQQESAAPRAREVPPARALEAEVPERDLAAPAKSAPIAPSAPAPAPEAATREQNDLRALEDQALRQIDVAPILRAAGIDGAALAARPDGNDTLRHIAADELLTRSIMRDLLSNTIYPYGYPREQALADARAAADRMMAAMIPEARADLLEQALADGSSAEPEPAFYGPDSGRVFAAEERGESPPN